MSIFKKVVVWVVLVAMGASMFGGFALMLIGG